ncbi:MULTISPECIES: orotidine-5'-phosphate decarboxylase [Corynebacterium]|uniref:Orotidine 5'-phosphate decarboxylase n=1 Tax=Corynebacterium minutissimum TaxID=38301 RepID=A0ACC4U8J4_9CORY|nr:MULTISPECIES: orotidine-5'-phosphate decarboxylase [Corynebacterium]KKO77643.1 orotidine 5'-phosphate decarboxylase [Corynebacterium minutissimum]OFK66736.1 orotidine 5'-phosphate decarboxylase [Corynebacterium sp. HMSC074A09]OFP30563.1 orotidine 5'-phosphate decarboxylase [Corynebacterium sp. HMSC068G04]OHO54370.1 orotidine 5'-phosphate decarboxylase [Corynebacterium sp. HMSC035E02]
MTQPTRKLPSFGERLVAAGAERGRLCVGIDPHPHLLEAWGLSVDVDGLRTFTLRCVEAFGETAAVVKPQVAFFERFGSRGFAVLEEALAGLREQGCLSLADAKRGDIGSTMAGYAQAWLGEDSPLRSDAVTVSPYLGVGALSPVFDLAEETGRGVFVLAATSNPEAVALQSLSVDGRSVAQRVVDELAQRNASAAGPDTTVGALGVVVGATLEAPPALDQLNGPVLLPGVGAQGATPADVRELTAAAPELGFANVSRAILSQGPSVSDLRKAVVDTAAEFRD